MGKIKPKKQNNYTAKILILAVVVILLICTAIFTKDAIKPKKEHKEIKWDIFAGQEILSEYEIIKSKEYEQYTYNLDTNEIKNSFTVLLPSEFSLENINTNSIKYSFEDIELIVTKTAILSKKEELKKIENDYMNIYDKVQIMNTTYDENVFATIIEYGKYSEDFTTITFNQEIRIYIKANKYKDYALIELKTNEKRIDKETISKIINSITINKNQIEFCDNSKCKANLNVLHSALNEIVTIKVDKNKYVHQNDLGLSIYNADFVTREYLNEKDEDKAITKLTRVNVKLLYGEEHKELFQSMKEEKINGKKLYVTTTKREIENLNIYEGTYIYKLSDNLFLKIGIESRLNNLDEIIKDFLNFDLK